MITYKKMSLFDAPEGSILVHACNAKGVWGSGIASEFKKRFPSSYEKYKNYCYNFGGLATSIVFEENNYFICNLITSSGFGKYVDDEDSILVNTTLALNKFLEQEYLGHFSKRTIYSNKFNSGLFNVPWEKTEKNLKVLVERYNVEWVVCELE